MARKGNQWIAVVSSQKYTCHWKEKFGGKEAKAGSAQSVPVVTLKIEGVGVHYFEDLPDNTWGNQSIQGISKGW